MHQHLAQWCLQRTNGQGKLNWTPTNKREAGCFFLAAGHVPIFFERWSNAIPKRPSACTQKKKKKRKRPIAWCVVQARKIKSMWYDDRSAWGLLHKSIGSRSDACQPFTRKRESQRDLVLLSIQVVLGFFRGRRDLAGLEGREGSFFGKSSTALSSVVLSTGQLLRHRWVKRPKCVDYIVLSSWAFKVSTNRNKWMKWCLMGIFGIL